MMGTDLFGVAEAGGELVDVSLEGRDHLFHVDLWRRYEIEFTAAEELADILGGEIGDGGFRDEVR
jgi:hypothetical protein